MITQDDIDAFAADNAEALAAAAKYEERARRGLPVDRWATAKQAALVAQGIRAQLAIIAMMADAIEAMAHGQSRPD